MQRGFKSFVLPSIVALSVIVWAQVDARPAMALDKVKISYVVPTVNYGAVMVGIDKGYFAQEGIEVELVQAGGGVATPDSSKAAPPSGCMTPSGNIGRLTGRPNTALLG